jgi:acyl dehydratase
VQALAALVTQEVAVSDWVTIEQQRIELFAQATGDHQWIHVDVERARRESPFKAPIAHGLLTLSLVASFYVQSLRVEGPLMAVNYGLNRVRFPAPVPVGSRVRARFTLLAVEPIDGGVQAQWHVNVEREGMTKPVCVAETLMHYYLRPAVE